MIFRYASSKRTMGWDDLMKMCLLTREKMVTQIRPETHWNSTRSFTASPPLQRPALPLTQPSVNTTIEASQPICWSKSQAQMVSFSACLIVSWKTFFLNYTQPFNGVKLWKAIVANCHFIPQALQRNTSQVTTFWGLQILFTWNSQQANSIWITPSPWLRLIQRNGAPSSASWYLFRSHFLACQWMSCCLLHHQTVSIFLMLFFHQLTLCAMIAICDCGSDTLILIRYGLLSDRDTSGQI